MKIRTVSTGAVAIFGAIAWLGAAHAQCVEQKILPSDVRENGALGFSVAIDGQRAVAGAPQAFSDEPGLARVYEYDATDDAWVESAILTPSDGAADDRFGWAVGIDGSVIVVGAREHGADDAGAAYVFRHDGTGWTEEAKLAPTEENEWFGRAVAIQGTTIMVGANMPDNGTVFVYAFDGKTWSESSRLSDGSEGASSFGESICLQADNALIGSNGLNDAGVRTGLAHVYVREGENWQEEARLMPSDGASSDRFGFFLSMQGDMAVVGAVLADGKTGNTGAAYVYTRDAPGVWSETQTLLPSMPSGQGQFGHPAFADDLLLIGALNEDNKNGDAAGSVYVYRLVDGLWDERARLIAPLGHPMDSFGSAVAVTSQFAMIGVPGDDEAGDLQGALAAVDPDGADCNVNGFCDGNDIAEERSEDRNGNLVPDECECLGDVDGSGAVAFADVLAVLAAWGPCEECPEDIIPDGIVDFADLLRVLATWGPCPQTE